MNISDGRGRRAACIVVPAEGDAATCAEDVACDSHVLDAGGAMEINSEERDTLALLENMVTPCGARIGSALNPTAFGSGSAVLSGCLLPRSFAASIKWARASLWRSLKLDVTLLQLNRTRGLRSITRERSRLFPIDDPELPRPFRRVGHFRKTMHFSLRVGAVPQSKPSSATVGISNPRRHPGNLAIPCGRMLPNTTAPVPERRPRGLGGLCYTGVILLKIRGLGNEAGFYSVVGALCRGGAHCHCR